MRDQGPKDRPNSSRYQAGGSVGGAAAPANLGDCREMPGPPDAGVGGDDGDEFGRDRGQSPYEARLEMTEVCTSEVLEVFVLQMGKGQVLPVFSAGWAARGYLFAEAPGGGWYVRACIPGQLISLLVGPCAGVEWIALDPRPGPRSGGEAANLMPRENFVDYLLA